MGYLQKVRGFVPFLCIVFLNAFVDLGHKIIVQNTIFKVYDGQLQIILTAVVNALILLPFIAVFSPSGYFSDKYPKHRVMQISAAVAVGLTVLITLFYYLGWFWLAFAMTFLLALQSALYSPAKYGYIKELVGKEKLAGANGLVQTVTTVAILGGVFVFSLLFEYMLADQVFSNSGELLSSIWLLGGLLVLFSLVEFVMSLGLPTKQTKDTSMRFDWKQYSRGSYLRHNLLTVLNREVIFLSIIGLSIFWAVSQVVLAAFPTYAENTLAISNTALIQGMMAVGGIGIILGSLLAGYVSRNYIETGLIPIGSLGIALCLLLLPSFDSVLSLSLIFGLWGVLGGVFIVPLNALIQFHAGDDESGRVLAANNFIQHVVMLSFLALAVVFALLGIDSTGLFWILALVAFVGALYTIYKLPQSLIRFVLGRMLGSTYRLQVSGLNNLPESGGVLLLGNHISWLDWAVIQLASPRQVRFVMLRSIYDRWYLKWLLNIFAVIPISGGGSRSALRAINESLNHGEVVCLFPEGSISRTGQLANFQKGFEKAAENADAVIVPFYLRGLWGSRFSRSSSRIKVLRRSGVRRDIVVALGAPMPIDSSRDAVKQKVFDLSITSWNLYTPQLPTLAPAFVDAAKSQAGGMMVADSVSGALSGSKLLTAVICFSRLITRHSPEQNIGLLLPTSNAGAIANMAALMCGKTLVNLNFTASREALQAAVHKADIRIVYCSSRFLDKLEQKGVDIRSILPDTTLLYMEDLRGDISKEQQLLTLLQVRLLPRWLLKFCYCKRINTDSPAAILFSSGSEGEPKGVVLSHTNIMANLKQISDVLNTEESDVVMATLPLFHAFGLTVTTFMPLIEGIPFICHPDPTDVVNISKSISRYRATIFCGTSTFLRLFIRNQKVHPLMLSSLRVVVAGAEKLNSDVRQTFQLKFNKAIYEGYGATETTPVASVNIPDVLNTQDWQAQIGNKIGTVGLPLPGSSFRIVDPETLEVLPTGEDGLILIGGCQVMLGYLKDEEKTSEVIAEIDGIRWYKTGDKGHIDGEGFLTIVDRYSRFAKLGGEMISLTAVEEQVRASLAAPELELMAINLPDAKKGEKIVLIVAEEYVLSDVKKSMIDNKSNPLMIPSQIVIAEIPKLGSGKTDFKTAQQQLLKKEK